MRSLGTLKLPEEDAQQFLEAIHAYGYERSAAFLRRCAYAIIEAHQAGEHPTHPLAFRTARGVFYPSVFYPTQRKPPA